MCFIWILCYNFGTNIRFQFNPLPYGWLKTLIPYGGGHMAPPCFSALRRARDLRFSREGSYGCIQYIHIEIHKKN